MNGYYGKTSGVKQKCFPWKIDMEPWTEHYFPMGKTPKKRSAHTDRVLRKLYLGQWLAVLDRKAAHVAEAISCTPGYLSLLISGKHKKNPSTSFMLALSEELGISVNALFSPPPPKEAIG
jgi:hypothetical protein